MDEYISREALLAEIAADYGKWVSCNDTDELYRQGVEDNYNDNIRLINEMPSADVQPVNQWISVKDRLPEEQQCILVHEKDYGVMLGDYQGIKYSQPVWIVRKQGLIMRTTEVTHWQPLPEPPKDGDTE